MRREATAVASRVGSAIRLRDAKTREPDAQSPAARPGTRLRRDRVSHEPRLRRSGTQRRLWRGKCTSVRAPDRRSSVGVGLLPLATLHIGASRAETFAAYDPSRLRGCLGRRPRGPAGPGASRAAGALGNPLVVLGHRLSLTQRLARRQPGSAFRGLRDTQRVMWKDSTSRDLLELARAGLQAANRFRCDTRPSPKWPSIVRLKGGAVAERLAAGRG
jgi:hypothetical protein